jgi:RHS repeat-associated protein
MYDRETNLHYNYFRDYDPQTGKYLQSDPIGLAAGTTNTFGYVGGNPVGFNDPFGLFTMADMPSLPSGVVDFGAGLGDVLTFGISGAIRELFDIGNVNKCSSAYTAGEAAGVAASVSTGFAGGTKAVARASSPNNWSNFSHSATPASWRRGSSWSKTGNRANGDHIPTTGTRPDLHDLMDATAAGIGGKFPTWPAWRRSLNRVPYTPGGALYGAASAAMNDCQCSK